MNEQKTDKVNEMAIMSAALRHVGTLELKVPRTRDGHFSPQCLNVINETKSPHGFNVGNVCIRRFNSKYKIVEELCGKSVSKSFVSSLTEH